MRRLVARLDPERLIPWVCAASVFAWQAAIALRFPPRDGDLLWQRWLGERVMHEHAIPRVLGHETFTAEGARWTPQEWLFSTLLAWSGDHGAAWLVPLLCALAAGVVLASIVIRSRRRGVSPLMASAGLFMFAFSSIQSFGPRAQVFGWAGLALVVTLLESEGPWVWAAIPATALWANLHASAFLAPAVAMLFAFAALLRDRRWSPAVRRFAALTAGCAAATLATPFGTELLRYTVELSLSPIRDSITEWGVTSLHSFAFTTGALPLLLVLAVFGVRTSLRDRVLAVAFCVLLFTAVRNIPVFTIAVAPIALAALPRRGDARAADADRRFGWVTVAAIVCCGVFITALTWRDGPGSREKLPLGSARALIAQAHGTPRVLCEDFAWCSVFLDAPVRVFMDGRCDPYPVAVWHDYRDVIDGNRAWAAVLDRDRVDAVLVRPGGSLESLLAERHEWRRIASDRVSGLYVRTALLADERR
ncbi:MAG TPA: hypothetical protein VK669_00190 [Candidatus Limnocylindrales bacterium]|nr:hypothetical protein [Candidatus Limnocylindrales bacterium]